MQLSDKIATKFFTEKEILNTDLFYKFIQRKKIIVFVPYDHVEKLTAEMSKAGAGLIGNYEMCSFRTEGIGTFKPNKKANPVSGKRNTFSAVKEVKLEMECGSDSVNKVVDALLLHHPYDETAYEIYDFRKRGKEEIGLIINFRYGIKLSELFRRINQRITGDAAGSENKIKRIAVSERQVDETIIESAKFTNCELLFSILNGNYKLFKI